MISRQKVNDVLWSILIGAVVAFVTVFLEGLMDYLKGMENNIVGGGASTITYLFKRHVF